MRLSCIGSGSDGNCWALEHDKQILLIDCGLPIDVIKRGINFRVSEVVGVLVTHSHLDHSLSADKLELMGIPVYRPYIENFSQKQLCNAKIKAFNVPHDNTDCYGFYIEWDGQKILYLTDLEYCPYKFTKNEVDHIIIECNYRDELVSQDMRNYEHKLRGHMSLNTCIEFIKVNKTSNLKTVILAHLGGGCGSPRELVEEVRKIVGIGVYVDYASNRLAIDLHSNNYIPF